MKNRKTVTIWTQIAHIIWTIERDRAPGSVPGEMMGLESMSDVPPSPVSNDMPLKRELSRDLSSPRSTSAMPYLENGYKSLSEKSLPSLEVVSDLKTLNKIEDRQNQLKPLTDAILMSREKALKYAAQRADGKTPEIAPNTQPDKPHKPNNPHKPNKPDTPDKPDVPAPKVERPQAIDKPNEVYDGNRLAEAQERAQREHKTLFIKFGADWCGPCQSQEKTMRDNKEIEGLLKGAVVVKINSDHFPNLVQQFGVESLPTTMIQKYGKTAPSRFSGRMSEGQLLEALR